MIGGLVDHNRLKNTTHEWAVKNNIKTVKLPIKKYLSLHQSHVLIVTHVFDILLSLHNGNNWLDTLMKCIPSRKMK